MSRIPGSWDDLFDVEGELDLIETDLLIDMLKKVSEKSQAIVADLRREFFIWELDNYNKLVSFIFDLCKTLGIEDHFVKYNACDLFEEFLHRHIRDLKLQISNRASDEEENNIWTNITNQGLLRLTTCIIISGKISSINSTKSLDDYCSLLKSLGQRYTKKIIVKSEIRVLETVDYEVDRCLIHSICPLLILTLVHNEPSLDGRLIYSLLYKVLDYFYLARADIYRKLYEILHYEQSISKTYFEKMTADAMLMSCAIIAVSPMLVDEGAGSQVLSELAYITCYDEKEISLIRDVMFDGLVASQ